MNKHLLWAEIDTDALAHNVRELRRITDAQARLLIAVKADGYGHGAERVAQVALANGADCLGVARVEEGVALREKGIAAPILIFGATPAEQVDTLLDQLLTPTVFSLENARAISARAVARRRNPAVHIKIDTGMGRLGVPCSALRLDAGSAASEILAIAALPNIVVEGIFTHFATADEADKEPAGLQFARFQELINELASAGLPIPLRHAANSGAIIDLPYTHLDMVRAGIATYGLYPSTSVNHQRIDLKPVMSLKTRIVQLKRVPPGTPISYGGTFRTVTAATIATVPVGYGDGYNRGFSNRGFMLLGGRRAPVVGRVCMDLTMLDVSRSPQARIGDEVVVLGRQGEEAITADELAARLGTINYEVVTCVMARVPRLYVPNA